MSNIAKIVGQRIRNYRTQNHLSQEKLAELSGCHTSYIGQIERGEKNATIESVEKIAKALNVSLSTLFEKLGADGEPENSIAIQCYEFLLTKNRKQQEQLYRILIETDNYKNK